MTANEVYELNFTLPAQYVRKENLAIKYNNLFVAEKQYFTPVSIPVTDAEIGEYNIVCRDLWSEVMYGLIRDNLAFTNESLFTVFEQLTEGTPFLVMYVDSDYSVVSGNYMFENGIAIIEDVKSKYGGFDVEIDGLFVSVYLDRRKYQPGGGAYQLVKGKNCAVINIEEDKENVITSIKYQFTEDIEADGKEGAASYVLESEYSNLFPVKQELYVEVPEKNDLAVQRYVGDVLDINKLPTLSYNLNLSVKIHGKLNLYDMVKIKYDALGVDVELKVISVTRQLMEKTSDSIMIGTKQKTILEYFSDIAQEAETVSDVEKNIVNNIENVINNSETVFNMIEEVTVNNVLVANNAMIMNCWIKNLKVEELETNFDALDLRLPAPTGGMRNYIHIQLQNITLYTAQLSEEGENYYEKGKQIYWTAIETAEQAYLFFTTTDPISVYPNKDELKDMTEEEIEAIREKFRVKIRRTLSLTARAGFGFDETDEFKVPLLWLGGGDENQNGRSWITKKGDGIYITYTLRAPALSFPAGSEISCRFTDAGYLEGIDPKDGTWKRYAMREEDGSIEDLVVNEETGEAVQGKGSAYIVPLIDRPIQVSDLRGRNTLFLQLDSADKVSGGTSAAYHVVDSWYEVEDKSVPQPPEPVPDYTYPDGWESYLEQYPYTVKWFAAINGRVLFSMCDKPPLVITNRNTPLYPGMTGSYDSVPNLIGGRTIAWWTTSTDNSTPWNDTTAQVATWPWSFRNGSYFIAANTDIYNDTGGLYFAKNV
jgi:hypothetical protein